MRILIILIILLPLATFAQNDFDPVRMDDGQGVNYFYPWLATRPGGNLICTWAQTSETWISGVSRTMHASGIPVGDQTYYQTVIPGQGGIVCPPEVAVFPHPQGGEAQFIFHA